MIHVLGISAFYHDSAAALLCNGEIVAAAQEERFTRKKHDSAFPHRAIEYVLSEAEISLNKIDHIVFYEKPFLKFERLLETYVATAPLGFRSFAVAMPIWLREKLFQKSLLAREFKNIDDRFDATSKLLFSEHHLSHAASAFYPSPFDEAVVLTLDGVGEWATTAVSIGKGNNLQVESEIKFPHSLGLLYSAFTYYTGFRVNSGEYKLMGLAPYGSPKYKDLILENLVDVKPDGTFRLNMKYFNFATGLTMTNRKFSDLFGQPTRKADSDSLTQFHMDIASSIQSVTEDIVIKLATNLSKKYGISNLCLAGGVALNCVANGKLVRDKIFKNVWIQPAAGDAGGALGAAQECWHGFLNAPRVVDSTKRDQMKGSYLGPEYDDKCIRSQLHDLGAVVNEVTTDEMIDSCSNALNDGKAIGWFQGRMEFGPRALGARSILGDPRSPSMQKVLNLKIKYRESFRPFAPSVLIEDVNEWFQLDIESPYMLLVSEIQPKIKCSMTPEEESLFGIDKLNIQRSNIPAVTHVDYSARVQTVHKDTNELYYRLISDFKSKTGCSLIVNTSFNVRGEPIVCTPQDAWRCFMGTEMDILAIGNNILFKEEQDPSLALDYRNSFALD